MFNYIYSKSFGNNSILEKLYFYPFLRFTTRSLANIVLPIYFRATGSLKNNSLPTYSREKKYKSIISLTSFPARIDRVWISIETLLRQTRKPDAIILWLSKEQFTNLDSLPSSLLKLQDRGLTIKLRDGDLRSHKKFFYVLSEFPDATVILADDDIFYPRKMLADLESASKIFPGKVICRFTKKIKWTPDQELTPYASWPTVNEGKLSTDYFFGSGGGVLIPPGTIHNDVLNKDAFLKLCPHADDIWLNAMCRLVSLDIFSIERKFTLLSIKNKDKADLSSINNDDLQNDVQLNETQQYCLNTHGINPFSMLKN